MGVITGEGILVWDAKWTCKVTSRVYLPKPGSFYHMVPGLWDTRPGLSLRPSGGYTYALGVWTVWRIWETSHLHQPEVEMPGALEGDGEGVGEGLEAGALGANHTKHPIHVGEAEQLPLQPERQCHKVLERPQFQQTPHALGRQGHLPVQPRFIRLRLK